MLNCFYIPPQNQSESSIHPHQGIVLYNNDPTSTLIYQVASIHLLKLLTHSVLVWWYTVWIRGAPRWNPGITVHTVRVSRVRALAESTDKSVESIWPPYVKLWLFEWAMWVSEFISLSEAGSLDCNICFSAGVFNLWSTAFQWSLPLQQLVPEFLSIYVYFYL